MQVPRARVRRVGNGGYGGRWACRRAPVAVLQRTRKKKRRTGRSHPPSTVTPQSLPRMARSGSEIVGLSPFPDPRVVRGQ